MRLVVCVPGIGIRRIEVRNLDRNITCVRSMLKRVGSSHMRLSNNSGNNHLKGGTLLTVFTAFVITMMIVISPSAILANDSTARLAAGGIELVKNEHIRMLEEVLEISPKKVKVKYRFLNEADHGIDTLVAFPLPFYSGIAHANVSIGDPSIIFATFKVLVNGKPVITRSERKALLDGHDITDRLRKLGLSDQEIFFDVSDAERGDLWTKLERFKIKIGNWWDISRTFFWHMSFPARKETAVSQEYAPATGAGWAILRQREGADQFKEGLEELWSSFTGKDDNEDCLDAITKRAIANRVKATLAKGAESVDFKYDSVEYILGTGRNWKGPIGDFTLRLIKEKPEQFVSVCFPGKPEKISPTVYEFRQKDFVPQDSLVVYFYAVDGEVVSPR